MKKWINDAPNNKIHASVKIINLPQKPALQLLNEKGKLPKKS